MSSKIATYSYSKVQQLDTTATFDDAVLTIGIGLFKGATVSDVKKCHNPEQKADSLH